ncbi:hypothetical protein BJY01DRAFT_223851, partial [Aspergillus pseudoustus]
MSAIQNAQDGVNIVALLLSKIEPRLQMSESFLWKTTSAIKMMTRSDGQSAVRLLMPIQSYDPEGFRASICAPVLHLATKDTGPEILEFLLQQGVEDLHVTHDVVESAVANPRHALAMAEMLLAGHGDHRAALENVMVAACRNISPGRPLVELLIERSRGPVIISNTVLNSACQNIFHGTDLLDLLMERSASPLPVTAETVVTALENNQQGLELVKALMVQYADRIPVTEDIIIAACKGEQWEKILRYLFDDHVQGLFQLTERVLGGALASGHMDRVLFLFDNCDPGPYLTGSGVDHDSKPDNKARNWRTLETPERMVEFVAGRGETNVPTVLNKLLARPGVTITNAALMAAVGNRNRGFEIMTMFCERLASNFDVTERLMVKTVSCGSPRVLMLLLAKEGKACPISGKVLLAAARNEHDGHEMLVELLDRGGVLTGDVLTAAARTWEAGKIISILTRFPTAKAQITEYFVMAIARHSRATTLLDFLEQESIVTCRLAESSLIAAAGNIHNRKVTRYLLRRASSKACITPEVIKAACSNNVHAIPMLRYLLRKSEEQIPIDEDILCAAAANATNAPALLFLPRGYQPDKFRITEDLLITAARN